MTFLHFPLTNLDMLRISPLLIKFLEMKVVIENALDTNYCIKSEAVQNVIENPNSAVLPKLKIRSERLYVIFTFCTCR